MSDIKTYDVVVNGNKTRMKLTEAEASRMGVTKTKATAAKKEAASEPDAVEIVDRTPEPAQKTYEVEVNGVTTTMKLSDEDAVRYGVAKPEPAPKPEPASKPAAKRAKISGKSKNG